MPGYHGRLFGTTRKSTRITTVREKVAAREVLGTVNPMEVMRTRTYTSFKRSCIDNAKNMV